MPEFLEKAKKELDDEEVEQKKKITSDDIRPGFSSSVRNDFHGRPRRMTDRTFLSRS
jgi:hypothetical protein